VNIQTVTGQIDHAVITLVDGHEHLWIDPPMDVAPEARLELKDFDRIKAELDQFRAAGGSLLVDCQPGEIGRNTNQLKRLAEATGLWVTATTGFHRQRYYPPHHWLWSASAESATEYFTEELLVGTRESNGTIRATTIKVAYEGSIEGQTRDLIEAAAQASRQTGALILFHTESGKNAEALVPFFADRGVAAHRLYICHVDKRPDLGFHRELAQAGVLLGYDTFARPKYNPEQGVWRLIPALVADGLETQIALGLDLAFANMWQQYGGAPGLTFLPTVVVPRLQAAGFPEIVIRKLMGANIAQRLASAL